MDFGFNSKVAERYGVEEAILLHNLYWWIRKNEANGRHYYDGKTWTYNSSKAFAELFPFWNGKKIRRLLDKLRDDGALIIGCFNENKMDRTQWYSLSDDVYEIYGDFPKMGSCIGQNREMEETISGNLLNKDTDSKLTDSKHIICENSENGKMGDVEFHEKMIEETDIPDIVKEKVRSWLKYKKKQHKFTYTEYGFKPFMQQIYFRVRDYGATNVIEVINESMANGYKGILWDKLEKKKKQGKRTYTASELNAQFDDLKYEDL